MAGRLRIFISSTMEDLANERQLVVHRLSSFNFECVNAETIPPDGTPPWERILEELDTCHLMILILGERYGWIPKETPIAANDLSVTHLEYRRAVDLGIPILPFLKRLRYSDSTQTGDTVRREAFRKEVSDFASGHFRTEFDLALDLAEGVSRSVMALLSNQYQRQLIQHKLVRPPPSGDLAPMPPVRIPERLVKDVREKRIVLLAGSAMPTFAGLPSLSALAAFLRSRMWSNEDQPQFEYRLSTVAADYRWYAGQQYLEEAVLQFMSYFEDSTVSSPYELAVRQFPRIITASFDTLFEKAVVHCGSSHYVLTFSSESSKLHSEEAARHLEPDRLEHMGDRWGRVRELPEAFIFKMFGSSAKPDTMVLTEWELSRRYDALLRIFQEIVGNNPLLLVGMSESDPVLNLLPDLRYHSRVYSGPLAND